MRHTGRPAGGRIWFSLLLLSAAVLLGLSVTLGGLQGLAGNKAFKPLIRVEQASDSHVGLTLLGRHFRGPHIPWVTAGREYGGDHAQLPAWKRRASDAWAKIKGWGREVGRLFDEWRLDGSLSLQEKPADR